MKTLLHEHEHDDFTHLVLAAPTVDISNLDTTNVSKTDDTSVLKQRATISAKNMISVAEAALENHKHLRKVIIMEHAPRFDLHVMDPSGIKPKLAKYANSSLYKLWHSSLMKDKIVIGKHNIECSGEQRSLVYSDDWSGKYDGVHMYGSFGRITYSKSVSNILKDVLSTSFSDTSSVHSTCPQTTYQMKNKNKNKPTKSSTYNSVPLNNRFEVLGN